MPLNATVPEKRHLDHSGRQPHAPQSAPQMTRAYSYVRFSTPDQAKGDSYRRQTEAANEYARRHGLVLDTELTFTDLGVSAFRGANAKTGALGVFLEAVKDGTIAPGSHLLIENLDRLTRADVLEAQELFTGIIRRGITLVTLFDQRAYSAESVTNAPMDLVFSILTMVRGHEESVTKSRRMLAAFEQKRRDAVNGTERNPFTRMLHAWLRWNETTRQHEAIEDRAEIVRDIFTKTDAGWGKHRITNALNEAKVETWDAAYNDAEDALARNAKWLVDEAPRGRDTAEIEAEIQLKKNLVWALVEQAEELADIATTEKSEVARRRLREREQELEQTIEYVRLLRVRRDTLASANVRRRLEVIEKTLTQKPLNVSDVNKALKQAVSKIVMDTDWGTLTFHWHHAEDPSEPITFAWPRREEQRAAE
jgi:DNA invertase Pin-like site-specific DNA recombinase